MVAFVLVGDEVGAGEGEVVGERGRVTVDVIAIAEHFGLEITAAFLECLHYIARPATIVKSEKFFFFLGFSL